MKACRNPNPRAVVYAELREPERVVSNLEGALKLGLSREPKRAAMVLLKELGQ